MTRAPVPDEAQVRRLAEASLWRIRLADADADSSPDFEAWLADDPANVSAWTRVQEPWQAIGAASTSPEVMQARADALRRARGQARRRWTGGRDPRRLAAALAAVVVLGCLLALFVGRMGVTTYRTELGERRVVTLKDGSRVSLDSATVLKVRYTPEARRLELLRGQARFDVAHNAGRPFSVAAGDRVVVATGTAFNIDIVGQRVLVTLIQGHVTVLRADPGRHLAARPNPGAREASISLAPGQELIAARQAPPVVATASLDRATAWENGQLVFQDEPLGTVVERVSRYSPHPIRVDPDAAGLRMSGVFNTGDVSTFLDAVTRYLPVQATETPDGDVTLRHRG